MSPEAGQAGTCASGHRGGVAWRGSRRDSRDVVDGVLRWRAVRRDVAGTRASGEEVPGLACHLSVVKVLAQRGACVTWRAASRGGK